MNKRIIAVFGPTHRDKTKHRPEQSVQPKILKCASELGAAIGRDHIVLTGGDGSDGRSVKDAAILSAGDEWIGVLRDEPIDGSELRDNLIPSGLGRARNLLEAFVCDAAIALFGGDGTRSEVACALALRRPIALVGCEWQQYYDLDGPDRGDIATALLEDARGVLRKIRTGRYPGFGEELQNVSPDRVRDLLEWARRPGDPQCKYFGLVQRGALADVVEWAAGQHAPAGAPQGPKSRGAKRPKKRPSTGWIALSNRIRGAAFLTPVRPMSLEAVGTVAPDEDQASAGARFGSLAARRTKALSDQLDDLALDLYGITETEERENVLALGGPAELTAWRRRGICHGDLYLRAGDPEPMGAACEPSGTVGARQSLTGPFRWAAGPYPDHLRFWSEAAVGMAAPPRRDSASVEEQRSRPARLLVVRGGHAADRHSGARTEHESEHGEARRRRGPVPMDAGRTGSLLLASRETLVVSTSRPALCLPRCSLVPPDPSRGVDSLRPRAVSLRDLAQTGVAGVSTVQTRCAKRADVHIAYHMVGAGPADLVVGTRAAAACGQPTRRCVAGIPDLCNESTSGTPRGGRRDPALRCLHASHRSAPGRPTGA